MTAARRHFIVAAGGTGGHMVPAHVLAEELHARGHAVSLITDARGLRIPGLFDGCDRHVIPAAPLGGNPVAWLRNMLTIWRGRSVAKALYARVSPAAVIGFGGYPTYPAMLAAFAARIPTIIHEQNAVLGRVNRMLAGRVDAIATAYAEVARLKPAYADKAQLVGNPVRPEIVAFRDAGFPAFPPDGIFRLLVIGGSQGASVLSDVVPAALEMLPAALRYRCQVVQQCRPEDLDAVRARYAKNGIPAELATYMTDMDHQLARAHLVIARSGASTVAELTAIGRPAILVPLPSATDDHQTANTTEMVAAGGARAIAQKYFTPAELAKQIQKIALEPGALANAARRAASVGRPDAGFRLADLAERLAGVPVTGASEHQHSGATA